jgi:23S rRNA pseudouridine955/2504/2580 synthase
MSGVETVEVAEGDAGQRLDRWLKRRFPDLPQSHFQKWLRTGQVRVDGKRVKANLRLEAGQAVRLPPVGAPVKTNAPRRAPAAPKVSEADAEELRSRVIHRDDEVIAIDKPAGLAVQGGTGTSRHLDGMLDALCFDGERPRLVHRLDRDTAGVLLLARTAKAAARLTEAFRNRDVRKLYWAAVVGVPAQYSGRIGLGLSKRPGRGGEKMEADDEGKWAETLYRMADRAGRKAAWLIMEPLTGRTHQLRAHCQVLGTPIVGDGKYGGAGAFLEGEGFGRGLHLCARHLRFPHPNGRILTLSASLPPHMKTTWDFLGFDVQAGGGGRDPFAAFDG